MIFFCDEQICGACVDDFILIVGDLLGKAIDEGMDVIRISRRIDITALCP